jgi:hypothetical protein
MWQSGLTVKVMFKKMEFGFMQRRGDATANPIVPFNVTRATPPLRFASR